MSYEKVGTADAKDREEELGAYYADLRQDFADAGFSSRGGFRNASLSLHITTYISLVEPNLRVDELPGSPLSELRTAFGKRLHEIGRSQFVPLGERYRQSCPSSELRYSDLLEGVRDGTTNPVLFLSNSKLVAIAKTDQLRPSQFGEQTVLGIGAVDDSSPIISGTVAEPSSRAMSQVLTAAYLFDGAEKTKIINIEDLEDAMNHYGDSGAEFRTQRVSGLVDPIARKAFARDGNRYHIVSFSDAQDIVNARLREAQREGSVHEFSAAEMGKLVTDMAGI